MNQPINDFIYHYHNGSSTHAWEFLGCHPEVRDGAEGFVFRVWAPHAQRVSVVGDFNFWNGEDTPMHKISQGIWEGWTPHAKVGQAYKYLVVGAGGVAVHKVDPFAYRTQLVPDTSSVIWLQDQYHWGDKAWLTKAAKQEPLRSPINIYEFHMGSWRRKDLPLGRTFMANLDSILKRRDITLPKKVRLVKAMVFPVVMYGCERWTVKKAEHRRIDAFFFKL